MSYRSHIHSICNRILDAEKYAYGELFTACDELYTALHQITGIDLSDEKNRDNSSLESGTAIGLTWAAMCIKDFMRTKRFMDGIYHATCDKVKTNAGKPVHILYTGTGPFATLVLPLTARFSEQQIQFNLLEVNEPSIICLKKMMSTLKVEKYIRRIEKADATNWKLPSNEPVDIFICETMQQGLRKEPQVAVYLNIVPQLPTNSIIIPEEITLKAALIDLKKRIQAKLDNSGQENAVHILGNIFTLNKETILNHAENQLQADKTSQSFPETTISIPAAVAESKQFLYLLTEITVYKQEQLLMDKSQLTIPLKLADLNQHQPAEIIFQYQTGNKPGIQFNMQ